MKSSLMTSREFVATLHKRYVSDSVKEMRLAFIYRYGSRHATRELWLRDYNCYMDGWIAACRRHKVPFYFSTKKK